MIIFGSTCSLNHEMRQTRSMLFEFINKKVGQQIMMTFEENINKDKVESIISHVSNHKILGQDGITDESFKAFVDQ